MVNSKKILIKVTAIISLLLLPLSINAAEVVYRIDGYNKAIQDFTIVASGLVPQDSWAYFENEYGATTGNRFNQIPRNRQASLHLVGWEGCTINGITLGMLKNIVKKVIRDTCPSITYYFAKYHVILCKVS